MSAQVMLVGGIDLMTPTPVVAAGTLRACLNYEVATRDGYSRIPGFERFDGGPGVAQFRLVMLGMPAVVGQFQFGEPVEYTPAGGGTARNGYVTCIRDGGSSTQITVVFEGGDYAVQAGGSLVGSTSGATATSSTARILFTPTGRQSTLQAALAGLADARRPAVKPVPGAVEADILATFMLRGEVYAIRDLPRIYFEGGYYTDFDEGRFVEIGDDDHQILDVRITGENAGFLIYDPVPGSGTPAQPVGSPALSSLPVSGSIDSGYETIPYSDGLSVSGGLPPYTWTLAEADTGPEPPADIGDLSKVRFLSEQTPAALWRAIEGTGGWERVPGGREMRFTDGTALADITTRAMDIDAQTLATTGWRTPTAVEANGVVASFPANIGSADGATLTATGFGFDAVLPSGAILAGIEVEIVATCSTAGRASDLAVTLLGLYGQPDNKSAGAITSSSTPRTYGGESDLWGIENARRADVVAPGFGVLMAVDVNTAITPVAAVNVASVRARATYAVRGGVDAWVWDGSTDVPIVIDSFLPTSGSAADANLAGFIHLDADLNADKPRLIGSGEQIRTAPGGAGDLIAVTASRDRAVFLPGQLEVDNNRSRYQFEQHNFFGQDKFDAIYGVSGAGPAFCFDGVNIVKIRGPLATADDLPRHVAKHGDSLALGFFGGALLLTAPGNPFEVRGEQGATAIEVGDRIMGLTPMGGDALGILCQSQSVLLRGLTQLSYAKSTLSARRGAIEYTAADMGNVVVADSFGLFLAESPESYAAAERNYLSPRVESWLRERLQATLNNEQRFLRPVAALAVRAKNQYRLFFRDGYILTMTVKESGPVFTTQRYFAPAPSEFSSETPWVVRALGSGIDASGRERLFCSFSGAKAGYLFEIDGGNTFDGDGIPHSIELNPMTPGTATVTRFDRIFAYASGRGYTPLALRRSTDYLSPDGTDSMEFLIGREDRQATITDAPMKGELDFPIEGEEVSLMFHGVSAEEAPHTLQYLRMYTDPRGDSRGHRGE